MEPIWVVGVGWQHEELTLGAMERLQAAKRVLLRTGRCGCAQWLGGQGIAFDTLDDLFSVVEDFDALNAAAANAVIQAGESGGLVYVVNDLADRTVSELMRLAPDRLFLMPGVRPDGLMAAFAAGNYRTLPASDYADFCPQADVATLINEIDSRVLASELKLKLMECYPDEHVIRVLVGGGAVREIALCDLDRLEQYDHRVCALIPAIDDLHRLTRYGFDHLNRIMRILRGPDGCPWDKEQTHESLRTNVVEEAYEVVDAINRGDPDELYDELGDLLLQVTLNAEIARQHGEFDISDVTTAICRKMISRHPHIFGDATANTSDDVLALWQQVKKKEKNFASQSEVMRAVTKSLPATMRAVKVLKRAGDVGFDWKGSAEALLKVCEETDEVRQAIKGGNDIEAELGDLLFSVVNVARHLGVQPEFALSSATQKFVDRFARVEALAADHGQRLTDLSAEQKDALWNQIKIEAVNQNPN